MIRGRCPTCSKSFEIATLDALPSFPFCSDRCKIIDLGRWIDGKFALPADAAPEPPDSAPSQDDEEE